MTTNKLNTTILTIASIASIACIALTGCNAQSEQAQAPKEPPKVRDMNDGKFLGFSSNDIYPHYATDAEKRAAKSAKQTNK